MSDFGTAHLIGFRILSSKALLIRIKIQTDERIQTFQKVYPLAGRGLYAYTLRDINSHFGDHHGWINAECFSKILIDIPSGFEALTSCEAGTDELSAPTEELEPGPCDE